MDKEITYNLTPYFSDYTEIMEGIVEDLANFANSYVAGEQAEEIEEMRELSELPIFRGYIEEPNGKQYVDSFLYEGKIYTEDELCELLKDKVVPIMVAYSLEDGDIDVGQFDMGVGELFYYKNGPDGMKDYFEPNEPDEEEVPEL